ncbi:MAG: biopolymer transporter ExbD [Planctomycetaceae bacterium]
MRIKNAPTNLVEADMTPMIDMVFQLVAFFMIVTNFDQQQADERVQLPAEAMARPRAVAVKLDLVLNVGFERNEDGSLKNPDAQLYFPGEDSLDARYCRDRIIQEAQVARLRDQLKDTVVSIRADADVPTGIIQKLIQMCQEQGYSKFALKARAGDGP